MLTALGATFAQTQDASPAQSLYGTWYVYPLGNPETDPLRREFRHNASTGQDEMIVTRLCPGDYRAVIARAVTPVEISENTIHVMKSVAVDEKGELNSECRSNIDAGVLTYALSADGSHLSISNPAGNPPSLDLARQDSAKEAALPANIYGAWLLPLQEDQGAKIQLRLVFFATGDIDHGKVRQIATCSKGTITLVSQVDSTISVSKDRITILQSASHEQQDGPFTCRATITSGSLRYTVAPNGATMTLSKQGAPPLRLTREHDAGLN